MEQFYTFVIGHWYLWLALFLVFVLIVQTEISGNLKGVQLLSIQEILNKINRESGLVVDVRSADAYQSGHIINAINLDAVNVADATKKLQKYKNKVLVMVCENGQSSTSAAAKLKSNGFEQVFVLKNGMTSWKDANLPVTKGK